MEVMKTSVDDLNGKLENKSAEEVLKYLLKKFKSKIALSTSLGAEDQVLTDMVSRIDKNVFIFTLDTGRLFPETYVILDKTIKHYGMPIQVFFPEHNAVEKMVGEKGINLFYDSIENRKLCCNIRKTQTIQRALKDVDIWITGLRKDQSVTRFYTPLISWNESFGVININPLLQWTENDIWQYIKKNHVPYHELHDKGFPSIGCQPCTRVVAPGEDIRSGRWWWETPGQKECGLHVKE